MAANQSTGRRRVWKEHPKHPGVYAIIHIESGRRYIGSAAEIYSRWRAHLSDLRRGIHHCRYLQNAWSKHGSNAFRFEVLEACLGEATILVARERYWMERFDEVLFNAHSFPEPAYGIKRTPEAKALASARMKGNKNGLGKHYHGKLEEHDVVEALYRYAAGEPVKDIANEIGIHAVHVSRIARRKVWWTVKVPEEIEVACRERVENRGNFIRVVRPIPISDRETQERPIARSKMARKRHPARKPRAPKESVACGTCGALMEVWPCRARACKNCYCSKECRREGARQRALFRMADPKNRERLAEINRGKVRSSESKAKQSVSLKRYYEDPANREQLGNLLRESWQNGKRKRLRRENRQE